MSVQSGIFKIVARAVDHVFAQKGFYDPHTSLIVSVLKRITVLSSLPVTLIIPVFIEIIMVL